MQSNNYGILSLVNQGSAGQKRSYCIKEHVHFYFLNKDEQTASRKNAPVYTHLYDVKVAKTFYSRAGLDKLFLY